MQLFCFIFYSFLFLGSFWAMFTALTKFIWATAGLSSLSFLNKERMPPLSLLRITLVIPRNKTNNSPVCNIHVDTYLQAANRKSLVAQFLH